MKGRENSEDRFEQQWREAFDEWSESAPKTVWTEIDRQLVYEDLSTYKSKLAVYRWVAAAILLLGFSFGALEYFGQDTTHYVVSSAATIDAPNEWRNGQVILSNEELDKSINARGNFGGSQNAQMLVFAADGGGTLADHISNDEFIAYDMIYLESKKLPFDVEANYQDKKIYYMPDYSKAIKKKQHKDNSRYWAGVGVGSGNFNPNYSTSATSLDSNLGISSETGYFLNSNKDFDSQSPTIRENMSSGETITMGVNFGMKLGSRWTLESGVQYARADALTETNVVVRTATLQEGIPATEQGKDIPEVANIVARQDVVEYDFQDVDMNNVFEFTSIPVKAGYLLIDDQFSVEVNAGVIANIYMGNRLSSNDPDVAELTIGPGDSSPYRDLSFSGLAGIQFGYRLMKKVDVVLEPNYRQSINTLTKSGSNFTTNPSGFALMTGLRFNFN